MKLIELRVKNFRGYDKETTLKVENLTALIGKNDAGKSTLLEALEIFFNNKLIVLEREDLSVNASDNNIEISCVFSDLPEKLVLDADSFTTLEQENLLNADNNLEIKKVFQCTAAKPKPKTYIVCNHPSSDNFNDLLSLKQNELKRRAETLNIDSSTYDARNNANIREAILQANKSNLNKILQEIPVDAQDAKAIYSSLEKYLPIFALFQSDRSSSDSDKEISDPMNVAIEQALEGLETEIQKIKDEVQAKALETANKTLSKLKEMNSELADSLTPEFKTEPKFNSLFKLSIKSDDGISINKRGSGVRRLILLNFFRAEAERQLESDNKNNNIIYAFEEPETSQHPSHQKMLIESFISLANNKKCQVLLTTHTPALGELLPLEGLRLIEKENGSSIVCEENETSYNKIRETLGVYSKDIPDTAKAVILVEGSSDVLFFDHLCNVLKEEEIIDSTFRDKNIAIIPTGGCDNLKTWVTKKYVHRLGLPFGIFVDSDKLSDKAETKNTKIVEINSSQGIISAYTRKRETENYLHPELFDDKVVITDYNDAKKEVNRVLSSVSPNKVLTKYWKKMNFEQIRERETYNDSNGEKRYELTEHVQNFLNIIP